MKTILWITTAALAFAQPAQKTFDSPQAAAGDLIQAAASGNSAELDAIFGPHAKTVLSSGDPARDQQERQEFAHAAQTRHELQRDSMDPNRMILSVGAEDWPFPVPIVKKNGAWMFDTAMGAQSMKARRIGTNELDAIDICSSLAAAEVSYAEANPQHDYAASIAALAAYVPKDFVEAEGAAASRPYRGYYFKVLNSQGPDAPGGAHPYLVKNHLIGGFAMAAWPAQYGISGINTFVVNQDGMVFEKDLGPHQGPPVMSYNPDSSWRPVQ